MGEPWPRCVSLVAEFLEWKKSQETTSKKRKTIRAANNIVASTLLEPRCPLGNNSRSPPRSSVSTENLQRDNTQTVDSISTNRRALVDSRGVNTTILNQVRENLNMTAGKSW